MVRSRSSVIEVYLASVSRRASSYFSRASISSLFASSTAASARLIATSRSVAASAISSRSFAMSSSNFVSAPFRPSVTTTRTPLFSSNSRASSYTFSGRRAFTNETIISTTPFPSGAPSDAILSAKSSFFMTMRPIIWSRSFFMPSSPAWTYSRAGASSSPFFMIASAFSPALSSSFPSSVSPSPLSVTVMTETVQSSPISGRHCSASLALASLSLSAPATASLRRATIFVSGTRRSPMSKKPSEQARNARGEVSNS